MKPVSPSSWLGRLGPVTIVTLLGSICLLLPVATGVEEPEIALNGAHHSLEAYDNAPKDQQPTQFDTHSEPKQPSFQRKNKPNKSFSKKYVGESFADSPYGGGGKSRKSIYDKRYFDYLPAEMKVGPPETPLADGNGDVSLSKRTNSRRLRRSADAGEPQQHHEQEQQQPLQRTRRQGNYLYMIPPAPFQLPLIQQLGWDPNHRPMLFNTYLPPVTLRPTLRPQYIPQPYLPPAPGTSAPGQQPAIYPNGQFTPRPQQPPTVSPTDSIDDIGSIGNRFAGDRFIFDQVYDQPATNYQLFKGPRRPPPFGSSSGPAFAGGFPTTVRPLQPSTTTSRPPAASPRPSSGTDISGPITTTTPAPVIQHNSDDDYDWSNLGLSVNDLASRIGGVENALDSQNQPPNRRAPSKCTWAIANCCSQFSDKIRYYCFEQNQCYGAFWGNNVCRTYYRLALNEIENYYSGL